MPSSKQPRAGGNLPDNVVKSINAKIQATQMAEQRKNEVAQAQAEAQKVEAEAQGQANAKLALAEAEAKAISLRGDALRNNPGIAELNAIEKWEGCCRCISWPAPRRLSTSPAVSD